MNAFGRVVSPLCVALTFAGCGGCGRVVAGGGIDDEADGDGGAGYHFPVDIKLFAETGGTVRAMASDADHLYWLEDDFEKGREYFRIKRLAVVEGGGGAPEQIAEIPAGEYLVSGLAVWGSAVYWTQCNVEHLLIRTTGVRGGTPSSAYEEPYGYCSYQLTANEDGLWWGATVGPDVTQKQHEGALFRLAWGTAKAAVVTWGEKTVSTPYAFGVLGQHSVFVTGEGSIYVGPRVGDPSLARRISVGGDCYYLGLDGTRAYIGSGPKADRPFVILVPDVGEEKTVYFGALSRHIQTLTANARFVFWAEDGILRWMPAGGGDSGEIAREQLTFLMYATDQHLYWSHGDSILYTPVP